MKINYWPIEKIIPYARNARKIPPKAVDKVADSIQTFGWRQPVVVDGAGVIICGHTRWLAARKLGLKRVPVHQADNLTPAQVKKENQDYLRWRRCMIGRGWGIPQPTPNAKGMLFSFGGAGGGGGGGGSGFKPPPGQSLFNSSDLQQCAAVAQQGGT